MTGREKRSKMRTRRTENRIRGNYSYQDPPLSVQCKKRLRFKNPVGAEERPDRSSSGAEELAEGAGKIRADNPRRISRKRRSR